MGSPENLLILKQLSVSWRTPQEAAPRSSTALAVPFQERGHFQRKYQFFPH